MSEFAFCKICDRTLDKRGFAAHMKSHESSFPHDLTSALSTAWSVVTTPKRVVDYTTQLVSPSSLFNLGFAVCILYPLAFALLRALIDKLGGNAVYNAALAVPTGFYNLEMTLSDVYVAAITRDPNAGVSWVADANRTVYERYVDRIRTGFGFRPSYGALCSGEQLGTEHCTLP